MKQKAPLLSKRVDVLDGIRAISVIIVLIFHFWQQTWIFPTIKTPFLKFMGITKIDFTPLAKTGYLFVDMMILISGFLLFLPVARSVLNGEHPDDWRTYFKKRAVRILPSYLLCVTILLIYELINGGFGQPIVWKNVFLDLFLHLTFMHTWTVKTYLSTKLNVVLWTLAIEVWFYILFPALACFIRTRRKERSPSKALLRAGILAVVMIAASFGYIYGYVLNTGSAFSNAVDLVLKKLGSGIRSNYLSMVINQLPAFFGTYAVGLMGAFAYTASQKYLKSVWWTKLIYTVLSLGFIVLTGVLINSCAALSAEDAQRWQIEYRLPLALAFMGTILSLSFSFKPVKFVFSNKFMVFLAGISYNLYIWHQWLCVKIKYDWHIPYWEGNTPPNQLYTQAASQWKSQYAVIITVVAFSVAILVTYLFEKPAANILNGRPPFGKIAKAEQKTKKNGRK